VIENARDVVSWNRVLLLVEGIGPKKAQELMGGVMETSYGGQSAWQALKDKPGRSGRGLKELATVLDEAAAPGTMTPAEQLNHVYGYYLPILKSQYDDYPKRIRDLEHLYSMAERYHRLEEFIADLALEPPDESLAAGDSVRVEDERLVLSTVHSAKGLEWDSVFIVWAVDGRFPSVHSFLNEEEIEEERRLFYVAVTRAKRRLFLSYPVSVYDKATGMILSKPTRFLDRVPLSLTEAWSAVEDPDMRSWGMAT
jgi:DNA helicase-2/ATP-dependent DNA helicase PcrA